MKILLATWNNKKINWLTRGLRPLDLEIEAIDPSKYNREDENGETCAENAEKKALTIGCINDAIVISEDSGLFCVGLGGAPGTHTARWAPGDDNDRAELIIEKLCDNNDRRAYFMSSICILFPSSEKIICQGIMEGRISSAVRGGQDTGYSGIFEMNCGKTIAEIGDKIVDTYNHRQRALQLSCKVIRKWLFLQQKGIV